MSDPSTVEKAIGRFETALHKLETSMVKIHEKGAQLSSSQGETDALRADHKKVSQELESVRTKANQLADVNRQAAKRVDQAMARINKVLE